MSKELDELLEANAIGGIKNYEQIDAIVNNFLNVKASCITNSLNLNQKGSFKIVANICHLMPESLDYISYKEMIYLLFNADMFEDFGTPNPDDSIDYFIYPYFITFGLLNNLLSAETTVPEISQFLNINFYKFSQYMTELILNSKKENLAYIHRHLMKLFCEINNNELPEDNATIRDILNMLKRNYRAWYPGIESINIYKDKIMAIGLAAWDILVAYHCEATYDSSLKNVYSILERYGDKDFYDEFNELYTIDKAEGNE